MRLDSGLIMALLGSRVDAAGGHTVCCSFSSNRCYAVAVLECLCMYVCMYIHQCNLYLQVLLSHRVFLTLNVLLGMLFIFWDA